MNEEEQLEWRKIVHLKVKMLRGARLVYLFCLFSKSVGEELSCNNIVSNTTSQIRDCVIWETKIKSQHLGGSGGNEWTQGIVWFLLKEVEGLVNFVDQGKHYQSAQCKILEVDEGVGKQCIKNKKM